MIDPNTLAELAMEVENGDPIFWGMMSIDQKTAYHMMASKVIEQFLVMDTKEEKITLLAAMTKLLVENFVLNMQLIEARTHGK